MFVLFGYLAGSCPTGFLAALWLRGTDIRTFGSGNTGAANAGRLLGKKWGVAVAVIDMLKGGAAVLIVSVFTKSDVVLALVGIAAVIGHDYPVWLHWRGGKGVAATFGVIAFFDFFNPIPALLGGCVWYLILKKTKYVSLSSMLALFAVAASVPLFKMPFPYTAAALFLACMAVWRHRSNIVRIKNGTEVKMT